MPHLRWTSLYMRWDHAAPVDAGDGSLAGDVPLDVEKRNSASSRLRRPIGCSA
jgi:hypothetical protein